VVAFILIFFFAISEYLDEAMLIPKNTSVLIRRVPGRPRIRIITREEPRVEDKVENVQADMNNVITADASPVSWLSQFLLAWNPSTQILIYNLIYLIG
jgi:hypothetical protein